MEPSHKTCSGRTVAKAVAPIDPRSTATDMLDLVTSFIALTALFAYLNHRFVRLPTTIGVMSIALLLSAAVFLLDWLGLTSLRVRELELVRSIDFAHVLMQGMLSMLLFAGALHVDLSELKKFRWQIGLLAGLGTLLSTIFVGVGLWALLPMLGMTLPLTYCLVFGALISPTDPIAVAAILNAHFRSTGDGGGWPHCRQPRTRVSDVEQYTRLHRYVLGAVGCDLKFGAVRAHRSGSDLGTIFRKPCHCRCCCNWSNPDCTLAPGGNAGRRVA